MSFREQLELFRPLGCTDAAFARLLNVPLMTLKGLLRGSEPSENTVKKMADALEKSPVEIRYGVPTAKTSSGKAKSNEVTTNG